MNERMITMTMSLIVIANIGENLVMNECCIFRGGSNCNPGRGKFTVSTFLPTHPQQAILLIMSLSLSLAPAGGTTGRFLSQGHPILLLADQEPVTWPVVMSTPKKELTNQEKPSV